MIAELSYSHNLKMNRGSLHTRGCRRIHLSFLNTDEIKMALPARKVFGAFEKRARYRHSSFEPRHSGHSDDVMGCCLVTILRARLTANHGDISEELRHHYVSWERGG